MLLLGDLDCADANDGDDYVRDDQAIWRIRQAMKEGGLIGLGTQLEDGMQEEAEIEGRI